MLKTLEFSLVLSPEEIEQFREWRHHATHLWNCALEQLLRLQYWRRLQPCLDAAETDWGFVLAPAQIERSKIDGEWVDFCRLGREFRIDKTKSWDKENIEWRECRQIVPAEWVEPPPIENFSFFTVKKLFTKARFDTGDMPSCYVEDVVETLCEVWALYQKGQRGKPKFKGKRNRVSSFGGSFRHHCRPANGHFTLPKMGKRPLPQALQTAIGRAKVAILQSPDKFPKVVKAIQVPEKGKKTLSKQLMLDEAAELYSLPGGFRILEREGRFYLQCSIYCPGLAVAERERDGVAIQCGMDYLYSTGNIAIPHLESDALLRRLEALQRVAATKRIGSNNWYKVQCKIKCLHRRISQQRRRWQQFHAQWLTDRYSKIMVERVEVKEAIGVPIPIPAKDGDGYLPNCREEEGDRNREVLSRAIGQFIELLKQQGSDRGCEIEIVDKVVTTEPIVTEPIVIVGEFESIAFQPTGDALPPVPIPKRVAKLPRRNRKKERAIG